MTDLWSAMTRNILNLLRGPSLAALFTIFSHPVYRRWIIGSRNGSGSTSEIDLRLRFCVSFVLLHLSLWLGMNGFFLYDEKYNDNRLLGKYKISRDAAQIPSHELIRDTIKTGLINQVIVQPFLLIPLFTFLRKTCGMEMTGRLPSFSRLYQQFAICQFSESLLFYTTHRLLHYPPLYKRYHKKHHSYTGSIGFAAEYAHPIESVFSNYLPVLLAPVSMGVHYHVLLVWLLWRLFATYERHSGYDFSSSPLGRIGLLHGEGARYHDSHHSQNVGNYGSGLDIFDVLCGTRVYIEDMEESKRKKKVN